MMQPNRYSRLKSAAFLMGFFAASITTAGSVPSVIAFEEGEQFNLTLSNTNFNRIFVEGEKIVKLSYTEHAFVVDKSEMNDPVSSEGSIYLKPNLDIPVTLFLTTDKGHHFSLTVSSNEAVGKTLKMVTKPQSKLHFAKQDVSDLTVNETVLSAMKAGKTPHDFRVIMTQPKPFYIKKDIKVVLKKQFEGESSTGYVYQLENTSKQELALNTALFSHPKALSLSLSEERLAPKQVAYLYGLYSNAG
jgi:conjugal transfer pilus assembly protein TraK